MDAASGATRSRVGGRASATGLLGCVLLANAGAGAADTHERLADGVAVRLADRRLEVPVCRDDVVRVSTRGRVRSSRASRS
jgi:hypothetical protein